MNAELIELFYQNDAVEGVAVFNADGSLVESQLALSEDAVKAFGPAFSQIKNDLGLAARKLLGFSIQVDSYLLHIICHGDSIYLLQLTQGCSVNEVYLHVRSLLGDTGAEEPAAVVPEPTVAAQEPAPEPVAVEPEIGPDDISWAQYHASLLAILKKVAPSNLASKMITESAASVGFDEASSHIHINTATVLGQSAVERIPNAGRRKIVAKEYALMISKLRN